MRIVVLLTFMLFSGLATAQTAFATLSMREAMDIAEEEGTFVIAYFFANRQNLPRRKWLNDSLQTLQNRFVSTWIDASFAKIDVVEFGVKSLPTIIILDANGKEYYRRLSYANEFEMIDILNEFPQDMRRVYVADSIAQSRPADFEAQLNRALAYQDAARDAERPIAGQLVKVSDDALTTAVKLLADRKDKPAHLVERLALIKAENLLLRNKAKKAIVTVSVLEDELHESNLALAYYIKGVAYRSINLKTLAEDYYNKLLTADDNEELLTLYRKQR